MALQQLLYPTPVPHPPKGGVSNGINSFVCLGTIDANDEKVAHITLIQKAGTLSKVYFRLGTVTSASDLEVRLETVDEDTGAPTGTLFDGANGTATVASGGMSSDTWIEADISDVTIADGDVGKPLAVVIQAPSSGYTGNLEIDYCETYFASGRTHFSNDYWARVDSGSGYVNDGYNYDDSCALRFEYSDGSFPLILSNYAGDSTLTYGSFTAVTTPDEVGIKIRFPYSFRACGVWFSIWMRNDIVFKVYNAADVEQATLQSFYLGWTARAPNYKGVVYVYGDTFEITANEWYRITAQAATSEAANRVVYSPQATPAHFGCWGLDADDYVWTERTNEGAWTDRSDRLLFGGVMMDQIHDGVGGGSTIIQRPRRVM